MIKELEEQEVNQVMDIWLDTNITGHSFIEKEYFERNYDEVKNKYFPASKTFVFKEDEIIKGFVSVMDKGFIGALFVKKEYQGNGIGTTLLKHIEAVYKKLELCVFKENKKAVDFYKSYGFEIKELRKNETTPHFEYLMEKTGDSLIKKKP